MSKQTFVIIGASLAGAKAAEELRNQHSGHGVELLLGTGVESFEGDRAVTGVRADGGQVVDCEFAVVGIGVAPRVELAHDAGMKVENGILVDEKFQTSSPGVFAAGDVANAWHPSYERRIRVEHWANALNQGPAAARAMLGEPVSYTRIPYFFSDQYEVGMEYSGYAPEWDVWDVNEHIQALIRSEEVVEPSRLQDLDTPLDSLVDASSAGA